MSLGLGPILFLPTGATGRFRLAFARADGTPIDLTGATAIKFFVTDSPFRAEADFDLTLALADGLVVTDAVAGLVDATVSATRSAALRPYGEFFYFARATLASGEVVVPDRLRGTLWTDLTSALNQAANGDALVRLDPPSGEISAVIPDMANALINRYDLTGLYGGTSADLDGLSAAVLANLQNGARIQLGFAGRIVAQYVLRALVSGEVDTPGSGRIVVFDNAPTRVAELEFVMKEGLPCTWDELTATWCQVTAYGAAASLITPGFTLAT